MNIRKIVEQDAKEFLDMLKILDSESKTLMYEPGERQTTVEEMKNRIKDTIASNSLILASEVEGNIVGFLTAERGFANRIKHSAYIVIGIMNEFRGKGIGTKLFEELEKWANENGITRLELTVMTHNENGLNLYKKMGFKIEGVKERSLIIDGEYVDEYYMGKLI